MKNAHDIIIRPVLSEKAYDGFATKNYIFQVALSANRIEIKKAIEEVFGVKVERVNTMRQVGKLKRMGRTQGYTSDIKKAFVKLTEDSKPIEFFEGMA